MKRLKKMVELCPPESDRELENYVRKVAHLFEKVDHFSIVSKPSSSLSGFEKALRLANNLRQQNLDLDLTVHVTCRDLNRDNITSRLSQLIETGIDSLLVISGDNYTPQSSNGLYFANSLELIQHIVMHFKSTFKHIRVAGYPTSISVNRDQHLALNRKLELGATSIITQCLFDSDYDLESLKDTRINGSDSGILVEVFPSIALFNSLDSLEKCYRLTKATQNEKLRDAMRRLAGDDEESASFAAQYLKNLVVTLARKNHSISGFNICPFGRYLLISDLLEVIDEVNVAQGF